MAWVRVLQSDELSGDEREVIDVQGHKVLLLRHQNEVYAMLNACPHMGVPLRFGKVTDEDEIVCPLHRSSFSLETGENTEWSPWPPVVGKAMGRLRQERPLRVFATKEEAGAIWIELKDQE